MTIRDLVDRLEKIEQKAGDNTREELSGLISDIIEFDMKMTKIFRDMENQFDNKDIIAMLFAEGIKSGQVGEA